LAARDVSWPTRFEIWDVRLETPPDIPEQIKPFVVLVDNRFGQIPRELLIALPIRFGASRRRRGQVELPASSSCFTEDAVVNCERVSYLPRRTFIQRRGELPDDIADEIKAIAAGMWRT
jgi:mRNA-degrading endonuclease toxin of MazEF toxin-antitoxin module